MQNPLKRILYKHKWMPDGYITSEVKPGIHQLFHIWRCEKCGKVQIGQFSDRRSTWLKLKSKMKQKQNKKSK